MVRREGITCTAGLVKDWPPSHTIDVPKYVPNPFWQLASQCICLLIRIILGPNIISNIESTLMFFFGCCSGNSLSVSLNYYGGRSATVEDGSTQSEGDKTTPFVGIYFSFSAVPCLETFAKNSAPNLFELGEICITALGLHSTPSQVSRARLSKETFARG